MIEFRNPGEVHPPIGGYSHQAEVRGGRLLVISGQVGMRPDGSLPEDPLEQIGLALDNILLNLKAAGLGVENLLKLNWYLVGEVDTARRRERIAAKLGGHRPCSTLVYVAALASPALKVEVEAWAWQAD